MTANFKQVSGKASRKSSIKTAGAADTVRKADERVDSSLLSPIALMALGLTGAATAAVTREQANAGPAQGRSADSAAAEIPAASDATVDIVAAAAPGELEQQVEALVKQMLTEESVVAPAAAEAAVDVEAATDAAAEAVATDVAPAAAEPIQLAMADNADGAEAVISDAISPMILAQASTGAGAAGGAGTAAAGTTAAAMTTAQMIMLGLGAVAFGVAASDDGGDTTPAAPTAPAAPTLALGTGVSDGANSAEATQASGVVTVSGEAGAKIAVTFTKGTTTVTKTVTATGSDQAVSLAAGDVTTLGDGSISVKAVATSTAGLASTAATTSFTLDTAAPAAPTLALGTGVSDGATSAEATQAGGVATVTGESGASIAVSFSNGANTVTKTVTGTGAAQAVTLAAGDLTTLTDGNISISAVATDAAGNAGSAGTSSFVLDTTAPVAPTVTLSATQAVVTDVALDVALGANKALGDVVQLQLGGVNAGTAATVDAAALAAGKVTISIVKTSFAAGANTVTAVVTDTVGNVGAASANLALTYSSGTVSDGYLDGATVWVDMDDDGQVSSGDIQLDATTKGVWDGVRDAAMTGKDLIVVGGTDISTGLAFDGSMSAPAGGTAINPLTTMMEAIMEQSGGTAAAAQAELATALGLPTDVDLTTFDMVGATLAADGSVDADITQAEAIAIQANALMVANMIASGVAALDGAHAGTDNLPQFSEDVARQLANYLGAATGDVNLADSATLGTILQAVDDADTTIDIADSTVTAASASLATTNQVIDVISGNAAEAAGSSASATDPSILHALTQMLQVQNVFQGEQMDILDNEGVDMTTAFAAYDSTAEMLTEAGQVPVAGLDLSGTVTDLPDPAANPDTTAPTVGGISGTAAKPYMAGEVIALAVDLSEGAFVTGTPTLDLTIGSTSRVAAYDAGLSSSSLLVFTYTAQAGDNGDVTVTALNAGSNVIEDLYGYDLDLTGFAAVATGLTVDTTAPAAPTLALATDSGSSATDLITADASLAVSGIETGAAIEYSANGTTWVSSYSAASGSNTVYVRQTDTAGNVSAASSAFTFTLDTTAPTVTGTTPADGGSTATLAANLLLATDEAVAKGTGSLSLYKADGTLVETLDVSSARVTVTHTGGHGIAIDPTAILVKDQGYYAQMTAGAFTDLAGNPLAGVTDATTWNFTGAGPGVLVTIGTVAGDDTVNAAEAAASITVTGTLAADAAIMAAYTAADMTATLQTGSATPINLTGLTYDNSTGNWSAVVPAAAVSGTADYTLAVAFTGATGTAAEGVVGGDTNTVHVDTTAKLAISDDGGLAATGVYTYTFTFGETVTGFDATDVTVTNGSKGTFSGSGTTYTLQVTPTASTAPQSLAVSVAADAATGAFSNGNVAASATAHSVMYGDATANILTAGTSADTIFLGAGNDVIKLAAATGSTTAATDQVLDFASGDKIDMATILGTGGAGYTGTAFADTGAGFIEFKNLNLAKDSVNNQTTVTFDISFDAASINSSKISGSVIDLAYQYSLALDGGALSPKYTSTKSVWSLITTNLSAADGGTPNGKIALVADTGTTNPIIITANTATGTVLSVELILSGQVDTFQLGFESKANGGATEVVTADGNVYGGASDSGGVLALGVDKTAGASAGTTGTLEIVADTGTLGTVGDNQLHMVSVYDAASNTTHLQLSYDTNATFGSTTASSIIALDFEGDITANLTPASLTYI